jgi:hypothetical protein
VSVVDGIQKSMKEDGELIVTCTNHFFEGFANGGMSESGKNECSECNYYLLAGNVDIHLSNIFISMHT